MSRAIALNSTSAHDGGAEVGQEIYTFFAINKKINKLFNIQYLTDIYRELCYNDKSLHSKFAIVQSILAV